MHQTNDLKNFFSEYGFDFLETIDYDIHCKGIQMFKNYYGVCPSILFDVGANAGSFIRAVKDTLKEYKVYAFEPHPVLCEYITQKHPDVTVVNACCGEINGVVNINIPDTSVVISSILDRPVFKELTSQTIHKREVPCVRIDTYCKENNIDSIDYIKIDVEGYEYRVMLGLDEMFKAKKITCGHFEILVQELHPLDDIYNYLKTHGYKLDHSISNADTFFYK